MRQDRRDRTNVRRTSCAAVAMKKYIEGVYTACTSALDNARQTRWTRPIKDGLHDAAQFELEAPVTGMA